MNGMDIVPRQPQPEGAGAMDAFQRSPTLLAGAIAGRGGQVQVWGPDARVRRRTMWALAIGIPVFWIGPIILKIMMGLVVHPDFMLAFVPICCLLPALIAILRRPGYVTTDDTGMGLNTWTGSRAVRWSEVEGLEWNNAQPELKIANSAPIFFNLVGYPDGMPEQLRSLIVERAMLHPTGARQLSWVREPAAIAAPSPEGI